MKEQREPCADSVQTRHTTYLILLITIEEIRVLATIRTNVVFNNKIKFMQYLFLASA